MNADEIRKILARVKIGQKIAFEIGWGKGPIAGTVKEKIGRGGALAAVILTDSAGCRKIVFCPLMSEWQYHGSPVISANISK